MIGLCANPWRLRRGLITLAGLALLAGAAANLAGCEEPFVCEYGGVRYEVGEVWVAEDGCNYCECVGPGGAYGNGGALCNLKGCGCRLANGSQVSYGTTFRTADRCNTCTCEDDVTREDDGTITCTELACPVCTPISPDCPAPVAPNCDTQPLCTSLGWVCEFQGSGCGTCRGMIPECPPQDPPDPDCFTYAACGAQGWVCQSDCQGCMGSPPTCDQLDPGCVGWPACISGLWFCEVVCAQ